tara:strand:+ start:683 stop:877 length:195 start_codon:yes stop_codon:yes gene_type:complete
MSTPEILEGLHALADDEKVNFKKTKFAIEAKNSLGVYHSDLKVLARCLLSMRVRDSRYSIIPFL